MLQQRIVTLIKLERFSYFSREMHGEVGEDYVYLLDGERSNSCCILFKSVNMRVQVERDG